jgi:hypothetical protein
MILAGVTGGLDGDKLHVDPGGLREDPEVFRV